MALLSRAAEGPGEGEEAAEQNALPMGLMAPALWLERGREEQRLPVSWVVRAPPVDPTPLRGALSPHIRRKPDPKPLSRVKTDSPLMGDAGSSGHDFISFSLFVTLTGMS